MRLNGPMHQPTGLCKACGKSTKLNVHQECGSKIEQGMKGTVWAHTKEAVPEEDWVSLTDFLMVKKALESELAECKDENKRLRAAVKAVSDLIDESTGVAGLHLNGDIAPWDELLEGGRFEEWLQSFSEALTTKEPSHD